MTRRGVTPERPSTRRRTRADRLLAAACAKRQGFARAVQTAAPGKADGNVDGIDFEAIYAPATGWQILFYAR